MKYTAKEIFIESIKQYIGTDTSESLGGLPGAPARKENKLAEYVSRIFESIISGADFPKDVPSSGKLSSFYLQVKNDFTSRYSEKTEDLFFSSRANIIMNSKDPLSRARAISELWSPDLAVDDDEIFNSWKLDKVEENPKPYRPEEVIIQLNSLYAPCGNKAPADIDSDLISEYEQYITSNPDKIAVYDHPVPVFTSGRAHELEFCLSELDLDIEFEKECGVLSGEKRMPVLISISTTHRGLDIICEKWLKRMINSLSLKHLDCYLLSENKSRRLEKLLGPSASVFTVQGKYACHFGTLKYAQLIFEKAAGIRAGFKLDTDEGIHSRDLKAVSGKTWLEHLCHPYWGGKAVTSDGRTIKLGFNIGEYVDSRDLDKLGYKKAIRTPEVKPKDDLRGPFLLFNKGAAQAKGTLLYNRAEELEDYISHPLVKGGGYGVDNETLMNAVPVGFSMVGRAEDQQFYYSALGAGFQGIFNPYLRIIHYKAAVAGSEHKNEAGRNVADIYRMLLFRELMTSLDVIEQTRPFPAVYASKLAGLQAFLLWMFLILKNSAEGNEDVAEEYLEEGLRELIPLLDEIREGNVMKKFRNEQKTWKDFSQAVPDIDISDAKEWINSLKV